MYQLSKSGELTSCGSKDILKNAPCLMYNTHHDVTGLVNQKLVQNTKA